MGHYISSKLGAAHSQQCGCAECDGLRGLGALGGMDANALVGQVISLTGGLTEARAFAHPGFPASQAEAVFKAKAGEIAQGVIGMVVAEISKKPLETVSIISKYANKIKGQAVLAVSQAAKKASSVGPAESVTDFYGTQWIVGVPNAAVVGGGLAAAVGLIFVLRRKK